MSGELVFHLINAKEAAMDELVSLSRSLQHYYGEIEGLESRVVQLRKLLEDLETQIVRANAVAEKATALSSRHEQNTRPPHRGNALAHDMDFNTSKSAPTVKEMVLEVLSRAPGGLNVQSLIRYIQGIYNSEVPRTTLSPVLSRMKQDDLIDLEDDKWSLKDGVYVEEMTL